MQNRLYQFEDDENQKVLIVKPHVYQAGIDAAKAGTLGFSVKDDILYIYGFRVYAHVLGANWPDAE